MFDANTVMKYTYSSNRVSGIFLSIAILSLATMLKPNSRTDLSAAAFSAMLT